MRNLIASLSAALVALAAAPAFAQAPPPDSVTQVFRQKARPGMTAEYEAGRKKHFGWHKAQGDPWAWNTYEVTTGPDTGAYIIASPNHQWADFDVWEAKFAAGDTADADASMGSSRGPSQMAFWTQLNSLSRLPAADAAPTPLASLTTYSVKPGHDAAMTATIGKINAALTAANYPLHSIWYRLVNGGPAPAYAVVTPRANMATFSNVVTTVIGKQLGTAAAEALGKEFFDHVTAVQTELLQRRADLSYAPN
ncbi:MAG: hypothetical protein JJE40_08465 [Vicinamibacteria bacterium]|nr:hypothetical protein [Vicinamibacteria bacterium]